MCLGIIKETLKNTYLYRLLFFQQKKLDKFVEGKYDFIDSPQEIKRIRKCLKRSYLLFGLPFKDFWQCRCDELIMEQIKEIVPYKEQRKLWRRVNSTSAKDLLCNKWETYQKFSFFYKRDIVLVNNDEDSLYKFTSFLDKHNMFIVKPLSLNCGRGIQIIQIGENRNEIVSNLLASFQDGFIAEELIIQDDSLSQFHPQSVNTLRINTVNLGNRVEIKWPCLRIGVGESVVDNAGAGGIFGAIDVFTGRIMTVSDESHHEYKSHPDTNIPLIGFKIPYWDDACEIAKKLAQFVPDCRFVGWDLALTSKGWVLVEGNYSPLLIYQISIGKGIRKEFEQMRKILISATIGKAK